MQQRVSDTPNRGKPYERQVSYNRQVSKTSPRARSDSMSSLKKRMSIAESESDDEDDKKDPKSATKRLQKGKKHKYLKIQKSPKKIQK